MPRTLEIPAVEDRHTFNLARWEEVCDDPVLAVVEHRVETDASGNILMTPPPGIDHGDYQFSIGYHLKQLLPGGKVLTECPLSTDGGVKGIDVVWISLARFSGGARRGNVLVQAPEICVEVLSPRNTKAEIAEKKQLYFQAGAEEVWICDLKGRLFFFFKDEPDEAAPTSALCPAFPEELGATDDGA